MAEECSPTSLVENVVPVGKIEGTLAYISPEQTGRTDSVVDFRSDLYSLGKYFFNKKGVNSRLYRCFYLSHASWKAPL